MNLLDENITRDQVDLLRASRVHVYALSRDLGRQGTADDQIIPLLLRWKRPTLLTRDQDFFDRELVHARYCLVWFSIEAGEAAFFIRRFLRHPHFCTKRQRLGKVVRLQYDGIAYWRKGGERLAEIRWVD